LSGDKAAAVTLLMGWFTFGANEWGHTTVFKAKCGDELSRVKWALDFLITRVCGVGSVVAKE